MKKLKNLRECGEMLVEDGYVIHISKDEKFLIEIALENDKDEREDAYELIDLEATPWNEKVINLLKNMIEELRCM